jgi:hypothetical protein
MVQPGSVVWITRRLWTTAVVGWVGKRWRAGIFYFVKIDEDMS